jgi:hypothetical protein
MSAPRFDFLLPPSTGDRLLANATAANVELTRCASDGQQDDADRATSIDCVFQLRGSLCLSGKDAATLLGALIREFQTPRQNGGDS